MKLLRIILTILVANIIVLLPAEKSFASEFNTWEENFQQCVIEGAKEIYIYIVVDESGSLESYFVNNPTEGSPKDPKTDNGLPLRVIAIEEFLNDLSVLSGSLQNRGIDINVAVAGFGNADHNNWYNSRYDESINNPYVPFTKINQSTKTAIISEVKTQFTDDKSHETFFDLPLNGVSSEFQNLPKEACKVLIFFTDGKNYYVNGDSSGVALFCESVNSLREQRNTFLLGVHLSNESDEDSYLKLKKLFVSEENIDWFKSTVSENQVSNNNKPKSDSCTLKPDNSKKAKIYRANEKLKLDVVFKDIGGSFSDDNFEDTKTGPSKNVNLCDESQVATDENCIFKFRMGPSARFFSVTASLKENGSPASVEEIQFKISPPESFTSKEIQLNSDLSGKSEIILNTVEVTANYFGTYVRFDFQTISEEPTWVGNWSIAGFQEDNANKVLSFSSKLTSGYFVELESVDEVFRSGATHCFDLKIESANKQIENIDKRYYNNLNVELYSLANDKLINSSKYSINSQDNGICINFKNVEPQDIKLKPSVDIIGISNEDLSENFYYPYESIPKIIQLQDKATPPEIEILEDGDREPSARFGADQVLDFKITGGNVDQTVSWYTDNPTDLGEVEIEINGTKYLPSETIEIKAETKYEGSLIFNPRFNNETKNLDFNFGFNIGNTELASSRVVQPYIELPINTILFNSLKYFFLGLIVPLFLLIFFFFNNRYIQFDPGTKYGVVRLQYKRDEDEFKSDDGEPSFDKLKKPGSKNKSEENIKNFTIKYKSLFSKFLLISIKNDYKLLNNNSLKKNSTLPENESPRGYFIGVSNAVAEKSSLLIIARNENEFSKYLNEAKDQLRKYYSSNQTDTTSDPEPSKPGRRSDSGKPGKRGDSGKPGKRGDSGKPGKRGDSGKPGRRGDSGKPGRRS